MLTVFYQYARWSYISNSLFTDGISEFVIIVNNHKVITKRNNVQ
jgi:hypothetical protein